MDGDRLPFKSQCRLFFVRVEGPPFVIEFKTPPDLNRVVLETCSTGFTPWSRVQIAMLDDNEFKGS